LIASARDGCEEQHFIRGRFLAFEMRKIRAKIQ